MSAQRRLLFITLSNIGDLVMTTPLLEALHLSYPEHLIDVVADARSSALLVPCPYLGRLIHRDKKAGWSGSVGLVRTLREQPYDAAVDLRTAFLTLLIRCGQRGFKRRGTSAGTHAVQHHFTALAGRFLVVAPGANWPGKIWPVEHYATLIDQVRTDFDAVIVVGSNEDRRLGERLHDRAPLPLVNLAGSTTLLEAAACMARGCAFVGNDSGLGHMAAAVNIPTLTVFGPGRPQRYQPWGPRSTVVVAPNEDLAALSAETVASALRAHLAPSAGAEEVQAG